MLYKYVTFERIDILRNGLIRLTQPGDFNDPFELHPSFDLMSRADIAALPDAPETDASGRSMKILTPEALTRVFATLAPGLAQTINETPQDGGTYALNSNKIARSTLDSKYGILSLSETHDNLLMWAHYADNHRGFVIQFDETHSFFHGDEIVHGLPRLAKVEYNNTRPVLSYSTLESSQIFFRKSPAWELEKEVRLIRPLSEAIKVSDKNPYPIHLFEIPFEAITGIITGALMVPEQYAELMKLSAETPELEHIKRYSMQLCRDEYRLLITPRIDGTIDQDAINGRAVSARDFLI